MDVLFANGLTHYSGEGEGFGLAQNGYSLASEADTLVEAKELPSPVSHFP